MKVGTTESMLASGMPTMGSIPSTMATLMKTWMPSITEMPAASTLAKKSVKSWVGQAA